MAHNLLTAALKPELIKLHLESDSKKGIIREFIEMFDSAGVLLNRDEAESAMLEREQLMSTGMEKGIAIPHGKTDAVKSMVAAIGLKPEGIDFDCMDGKDATVIVATLSPASTAGPHIRFMAAITSLLNDDDLRVKILNAKSNQELCALILGTGGGK